MLFHLHCIVVQVYCVRIDLRVVRFDYFIEKRGKKSACMVRADEPTSIYRLTPDKLEKFMQKTRSGKSRECCNAGRVCRAVLKLRHRM